MCISQGKPADLNWLHADVQEAGMMASMRHPNVVMYLGVCLQPPCVVTEYCARGSLNDVFKRARATPALAAQLDWGRRLNMVLDAAKGMMYLHSSEPPVIHRDLKSPNLLVDKHWRLKVGALLCTFCLFSSPAIMSWLQSRVRDCLCCCMVSRYCFTGWLPGIMWYIMWYQQYVGMHYALE